MTTSFEIVHPDVPLEQVASRIERQGRRPVLVCEHERLVGMLDLDAIRDGRGARKDGVRSLRVRDAIAPDVLYCLETTDLAEAAELMRENRVKAIPVLGRDRRPVGIVALEDALAALPR
jgi:CBS domain-containing protein